MKCFVRFSTITTTAVLLAGMIAGLAAHAAGDPLAAGFESPPVSARPYTWWHWMNGNITAEGITADLEAMKRVGIGGAEIFNVDCSIPHGPVQFMSPQWQKLFTHAVKEAGRLGLKLYVHNCAGWSSSGGPWNTPEHAMQKIVASEVRVNGPSTFSEALPQPETNLSFYRDIAVLAFPCPAGEDQTMKAANPTLVASFAGADVSKLVDGDSKTFIDLPTPTKTKPQFIQIEFPELFTAQTVSLDLRSTGVKGEVQVSNDGKTFRRVQHFSFGSRTGAKIYVSLNEPVSARFWRVWFAGTKEIELADLKLSNRKSPDDWETKAGYDGKTVTTSINDTSTNGAVAVAQVLDLTSQLDAQGRLKWEVPPGDWVVLRIGHTPTGKNNHPAPPEATGLECDKLSAQALDAHWNGFMQKILDDVGPLSGRALVGGVIDSYEVGGQNWTKDFREEFRRHRGYDLLRFLPVFSGRVVDSPEVTDRFLWDVRRTIADLFAEKYYSHFTELCHEHGLSSSIEPYTGPFESLQCGASADIAMGEFWSGSQGHRSVKIASSVAHIYGKQIVGAESFTARPPAQGRWQNDPASLKSLGDLMYCQGINRFIFHRYALQPWTNRWPGMTMGQWGFHFERTSTWFNQSTAWIQYLTRCQFLLQQGRSVADVAYFCGETAPVELRDGNPALPGGYDFDGINEDVLLHKTSVKNGRLTLPDGMNYGVLVLPANDFNMTPQLLERIGQFAREGATIVGPPPQHSPSLENYPECDAQVEKLAHELWGSCDGKAVTENIVGKGRVVWGKSLEAVFEEQNLKPDFECQDNSSETQLAYVHRVSGSADIYFVSNQREKFSTVECTFRVSGKAPELWHARNGIMEPAPVWKEQDGRTTVRLSLDPDGSVFVVFRKPESGDHVVAAKVNFPSLASTAADQLEIQNAVYEARDGSASKDVTALLKKMLALGQTFVAVNNGTLEGDPAHLHAKQLRVEYELNGRPGSAVVAEGGTFIFPVPVTAGSEATWQPMVGPAGKIVVRAWGDGDVDLKTARGKDLNVTVTGVPGPRKINGSWRLSFPPHWGAPPVIQCDKLISWTDFPQDGVRYFSGTATYQKNIEIPADWLNAGHEIWLDLGEVKNLAEVVLNGHDLGILWKAPFCVNLTAAARPGVNRLQIKVTNLWPNRLIGDEQLPPDCEWDGKQLKEWPQWLLEGRPSPAGRLTFTTWHHWTKDDALLESGLLGPVTLRAAKLIEAK